MQSKRNIKARFRLAAALSGTIAILAGCGGGGGGGDGLLLPASQLFGPTVAAALARGAADEPLTSAEVARLRTEFPLSFTTDPIDL